MGSSGIPILGSVFQHQADAQEMDAKMNSAQYNADVANQQADESLKQASEQERQQAVYSTQVIGNEKASYGASGVSGGSGSAMDVLQQSARNAEMDALNIRHAGAMKAWAYQSGARLDMMNKDNAEKAGNLAMTKDAANGAWSAMSMGVGGAG